MINSELNNPNLEVQKKPKKKDRIFCLQRNETYPKKYDPNQNPLPCDIGVCGMIEKCREKNDATLF